MNETNTTSTPKRCGNRTLRFSLFALFLVGIGVIGATFVNASSASSGWHHRGGHHWGDVATVEDAEHRARRVAAWVAGTVDATEEQGEDIEGILSQLGANMFSLRALSNEYQLRLITEISRPQVDRTNIEVLRQDALSLADEASASLSEAFLALSEVLQPEQRQELASMVSRLGHHRRH